VTVQFGKVAKGSSGNTDSFKEDGVFKTTVTLGPKQSAKDTTANLGETLVHEGVHGLDGIAAGGPKPLDQSRRTDHRTPRLPHGVIRCTGSTRLLHGTLESNVVARNA
jgi:hypothetical protein